MIEIEVLVTVGEAEVGFGVAHARVLIVREQREDACAVISVTLLDMRASYSTLHAAVFLARETPIETAAGDRAAL